MSEEKNAYILGTERTELHRLGLQHQVWSEEARIGWRKAGFKSGNRILDLGSGPGFCTMELAYMVGLEGKVIAVDKSEQFLDFIELANQIHQLNIDTILSDFDALILPHNNLDGMFCRWALAWITNPEVILTKVYDALRPGAMMVIQEYFDWSTFQMDPHYNELQDSINTIYNTFITPPNNINVGKQLPAIIDHIGYELVSQRPLTKMVKPTDAAWEWPYSFLHIFLPKLINMGLQTKSEVNIALEQLEELTKNPHSTIFCPLMVEVIARKPIFK